MNIPCRLISGVLLAAAAMPVAAQQKTVPVRELAPMAAKTTETFGAVLGVRSLPDGSLIVNDAVRRQIVKLDSSFTNRRVLIDSAEGPNSYGPRPSTIIPYLGDSTLFVDAASLSLLVLDGKGEVKRVMSAPRPSDLRALQSGVSGVDNRGRLVYRALPAPTRLGGPPGAGGRGAAPAPLTPDSMPILRADFESRGVDTIGVINQSRGLKLDMSQSADGKMQMKSIINPLVAVDDWGVLSDGSVALVRGHDYHIDWVNPDGSTTSTGKIPFDWKRLTDEDKQGLVDSARTAMDKASAAMRDAMKNSTAGDDMKRAMEAASSGGGGGGGGAAMGGTQVMVRVEAGAMGGAAAAGGGAPMVFGGGPGGTGMAPAQTEFVPLKEIADYYPPIRTGAVKPDMDGNLWILPTTSAQSKNGELVYDIVNKKGELTERVRIPVGRSIAGFGKGGVVYLLSGDRTAGFALERTRILGGTLGTSQQ